MHIVDKIHHTDLHAGSRHPDGAHELAAHGILLVGEDVFNASAHPRARGVAGLLTLRQRAVSGAATMNAALVTLLPESGFSLGRPIGTVGPHLVAGVGSVQDLIELLAVVDGGVGLSVAADQLMLAVDADVVLVAVEAPLVLLRPAGILVLLCVLG